MKAYLVNNHPILARTPSQAISIYLDLQVDIPARLVCKPLRLTN